mmetsp:Transcript_32947/g.50384  ORF Transcript_32947/g.50384 Transcript_32947/m.50384 type:complete len:90 (-) Transcript_32947:646-915(-)
MTSMPAQKAKSGLAMVYDLYPLPLEDAKTATLYTALWGLLFIVVYNLPLPLKPAGLKMSKKEELDVKNRMVSFVHGLIMVLVSAYVFYL